MSDLMPELLKATTDCLIDRHRRGLGDNQIEVVTALACLAGAAANGTGRPGVRTLAVMIAASGDDEELALAAVREAFRAKREAQIARLSTSPGGEG